MANSTFRKAFVKVSVLTLFEFVPKADIYLKYKHKKAVPNLTNVRFGTAVYKLKIKLQHFYYNNRCLYQIKNPFSLFVGDRSFFCKIRKIRFCIFNFLNHSLAFGF